ncbi:polysaccharide biosynthesis tyrosine autokinase [Candidatus Zixiibacteriota bacterium]
MARYELNLRDYYRILRRHVIVVIAIAIGLGGLSFVLSMPTEATWEATATVRITQASDLTGLMVETFSWSSEDNIATQTMLISSQPVLLETARLMYPDLPDSLNFINLRDSDTWWEIVTGLEAQITAEQVGYSGLIRITARSNSKDGATRLATFAAEGFKTYSRIKATEQNTRAEQKILSELGRINDILFALQDSLKAFRQRNLPYSLSDAAALLPLIERRTNLAERLITLNKMRVRLMEGNGGFVSSGISTDSTIPSQYIENESQLSSLLTDRNRLLLTYTEDAEPIRILDERIDIVRGELLESIKLDITQIEERLEEYDIRLRAFPGEEVQLATLQRKVDLNTQLITQLETSLQEVQIRTAGTVDEVSIVGYPTTATSDQGGGQSLKTIIGLLLGLMIGIVIAFIVETMDTSIGTIEDVEEYIEVPVLAVIPHLQVEKMSEQLVEQNPELEDHPHLGMFARLITQYDSKSPAAEAYRTLRTNLQFAIGGTGESIETKNTFVFTSSSLQEGKSTTMANLAITVAQAGNRVLLMGCNMRRPTVYKSFGLTLETGMTDILTGQKDWRDCVKGITDMMVGPLSLQNIMQMPGLDNLSIVTAGGIPPNPSELLSSPHFKKMIEEASEEYDMVLVDCPPILPVTDAAIVGRQVDWAVLIYQVGKVPRNALRRAKFHLSNVGAHVLGLAMNDVKSEIGGYSPYSQYMVKYYGEETKENKTLLGIVKGLFTRKDGDLVEKRGRDRLDSHRITGAQTDTSWIKVNYFEQGEEKTGEGEEDQDFKVKNLEPGSPEAEDVGDESWFSKIPLWAWIALAAAVLLLVVSMLLGSCSDTSAQSIEKSPATAIAGLPGSQPVDEPIRTGSPINGTLFWSVHIGSFRTKEDAESTIETLRSVSLAGTDQIWTRVEVVPGIGSWHRVFFGLYEEKHLCERIAVELRETGQVSMANVRHVIPPSP